MVHTVALRGNNHLILNANKTEGSTVDFSGARNNSSTNSIIGEEVEVMGEYKYASVPLV